MLHALRRRLRHPLLGCRTRAAMLVLQEGRGAIESVFQQPLYLERLDGPLAVARTVQLERLLRRGLGRSLTARRWPIDGEVATTLEEAGLSSASTWLASTEAGEPVGALFASAQREGSQYFIRWIVVDPAHRRCGIGDRLVDELERTTTAKRLIGMVDLDDPVASSFWRSRGFVAIRGSSGRITMGRELPSDVA